MQTVLQNDETDCAAACLAMILNHFGKKVPIRRIRRVAGTDTNGTSGFGIIKCAEEYGLSAKSVFFSKNNILKVPYPAILHTVINGTGHYVVLSYRHGKKLHIQDPARGFFKVKVSQLEDYWTGTFFIFAPTSQFKKTKEQSAFFRFFSLLAPYKKIIVQIFASGIMLSIFGIFLSFYFRFLIDEVLYSQLPATLNLCSICYFLVIVFQMLIEFCRNELILHVGTKIDVTLLSDFFFHLFRLPMEFFSSRKTGEILSRLSDSSIIKNAISSSAISVALDSVMIILGGVFLIKLGSNLVIVVIIPVLISSLVVSFFKNSFHRKIKEQAVLQAERNAFGYECINGIATIKALSTEQKAFYKCEELIVDCGCKHLTLGTLGNIQQAIQKFVLSCEKLAIYWYGSYLIFDGKITLGQLVSFSILSNFFLSPLYRVLTMQSYWQEVFVSAERLADVFDTEKECQNDDTKDDVENINGEIRFENLSFSYGTREKAIDNVSFSIPAGKKVAFVGMSGSGKTTLIKLLMRFFEPSTGKILINSKLISDYKTNAYRKRIGYVPQDCLLFSGTIQENILWGMEENDKDLMIKAAKEAHAYEFINKLPQKFQTIVGEHGETLSGGERQRIALARVFATQHDILVMDEATASLDSISERRIMNTLLKNNIGKTTIMVAHRLSTIRDCDLIFVFDNGRLQEQGTHEYLMRKNGKYASLWRAQNEKIDIKSDEGGI